METLTYSRKKPENNDPGETWFPALAANVEIDDAHSHNGTDSVRLSGPGSATVETGTLLAASWVAVGDGSGLYYQTVTLPAPGGVQLYYDQINLQFRLSTGEIVFPTVEKVSSTSYKAYTNDSSKAYTALYSA